MRQGMAMAPQMIQAIELLELPLLDLEQRLQHEMIVNPALEMPEMLAAADAPNDDNDDDDDRDDWRRVDHRDDIDCDFRNVYDDGPRARSSYSDDDDEQFDPLSIVAAKQISLADHLQQQLDLITPAPAPRVAALASDIVNNLDENGYFSGAKSEIGKTLDPAPAPAEIAAALGAVQKLSPAGVGAANLSECLHLQLLALPEPHPAALLARKILLNDADDLAGNRLPKIAARENCSLNEVKAALALLRTLDPFPGKNYHTAPTALARPDVFISVGKQAPNEIALADEAAARAQEKYRQTELAQARGGADEPELRAAKAAMVDAQTTRELFDIDNLKWTARVGGGLQPEVSEDFLALFDNTARGKHLRENWERDPEKHARLRELRYELKLGGSALKQKFRENYLGAVNIIRAVRQREITLYRLAREIIAKQKNYLAGRRPAPEPLMMKDLAERLEMDTGTVSRAVSDKYSDTPIGIIPLRDLFTRAVATLEAPRVGAEENGAASETGSVAGEALANVAIRNRIRELINAEDKKKPLKDNVIQKLLATEGINIARRTVAKHRGILGLGDYLQRREY
jgi:RNA polymerase sigma-54 factor